MKVAIQGIAGSFHAQAAMTMYKEGTELVDCETFRDVFSAVATGKAERGVVAIENSLHGSINPVYRLLAEQKLWICGEVRLHIEMYLLGSSSTHFDDDNTTITTVLSQVPALEQCEDWLNTHLPTANRQETSDTAQSARYVASQSQEDSYAAIGSKQAAELYGATILAGPINDDPNNYTRFVFLAKEMAVDQQANRTSIIITEQTDRPGMLYTALGYFSDAGVNLSKLDSHPLPGKKRRYAFYIDFDCGQQTKTGQSILNKLRADNWNVQVLGSYSVDS